MSNRIMPSPPAEKQEEESLDKPEVETPKPVEAPKPSGIKVRALRAGFYAQHRKNEGDEFMVPSMGKLGKWMECVDPKVEEKHQKLMLNKRRSLQAGN